MKASQQLKLQPQRATEALPGVNSWTETMPTPCSRHFLTPDIRKKPQCLTTDTTSSASPFTRYYKYNFSDVISLPLEPSKSNLSSTKFKRKLPNNSENLFSCLLPAQVRSTGFQQPPRALINCNNT